MARMRWVRRRVGVERMVVRRLPPWLPVEPKTVRRSRGALVLSCSEGGETRFLDGHAGCGFLFFFFLFFLFVGFYLR